MVECAMRNGMAAYSVSCCRPTYMQTVVQRAAPSWS